MLQHLQICPPPAPPSSPPRRAAFSLGAARPTPWCFALPRSGPATRHAVPGVTLALYTATASGHGLRPHCSRSVDAAARLEIVSRTTPHGRILRTPVEKLGDMLSADRDLDPSIVLLRIAKTQTHRRSDASSSRMCAVALMRGSGLD